MNFILMKQTLVPAGNQPVAHHRAELDVLIVRIRCEGWQHRALEHAEPCLIQEG